MDIERFNFDLPRELIANYPVTPRDSAGLLVVDKILYDKKVSELTDYLKSGDILVFNDTKVIPAKLVGQIGDAKVEVTLHKRISEASWRAFAKPARKLKEGDKFLVADDFFAEVIAKGKGGEVILKFKVSPESFMELLVKYGQMPLPPYIKRNPDLKDKDFYQTVFAKEEGAVAAPTAGLHFTEHLLKRLSDKGVHHCFITLHVGAGTFLPVKTKNIKEHEIHTEECIIDRKTASAINQAKENGGRIIAVGTTTLRALESAADEEGNIKPFNGETDIFIYPGYNFKTVDMLFTNFHLPKSTLFMLVCAFSGEEKIKGAYKHAIENKYRFFSYGDATLLYRHDHF